MEIYDVVAQLGFPIAVAAWALYNSHRHEEFLQGTLTSSLKDNTQAVNRLSDLVKKFLLIYKDVNVENVSRETLGGNDDDI